MEELIHKIQQGEEEAFKELFMQMHKELYKIAKTRMSCEEDIQDAIQETMIEVYKHVHKLKNPEKAKSWIIKIFINKCNRIYRKKSSKELAIEDNEINSQSEEMETELNFYYLIRAFKI